jgi:trk system potassium uptake protein TrkH
VALLHPSRFLVLSFMVICTVGTLLLGLPVSHRAGVSLSWLDAAFTSVSATCVTGLGVVDTPGTFSGFGQAALLLLIQVGGLGIMVFSAAAIVLLGKRLSLSHERAAVDLVGASGRAGLKSAIRQVLLVTFATEAAAAVLLALGFWWRGDGLGEAAWRGLFTAVSAFCNAGFALQSDSLVSYADSPWTLGVTGVTIALGGLGPAVVVSSWPGEARRSLQARLVLWSTALLLVAPIPLIALLEWNGTLAGLSVADKLCNAAFQSVTLRTAGFNSIDLTQIKPATWSLMMVLMFIGGSPSSTAGGAKTTTVAVVLLAILAVVRGRPRVEIFGARAARGHGAAGDGGDGVGGVGLRRGAGGAPADAGDAAGRGRL